jgi:hypothetical protein
VVVNRQQLLQAISAGTPRAAVPQFNSYAVGRKVYGGGRSAPNVGKTANKTGYALRDAKRNAITRRGV